MTEPFSEANDADLADQALPAGDPDDGPAPQYSTVGAEADPADVVEQQQDVPSADEDYDRG